MITYKIFYFIKSRFDAKNKIRKQKQNLPKSNI